MIELIQTAFQIPTLPEIITIIFNVCCGIIYLIGEATGMGYELANLIIFVILHPMITFAFFVLWRSAKSKSEVWKGLYNSSIENKQTKTISAI
jgi:hypothetical protein